jgi:phage protein U
MMMCLGMFVFGLPTIAYQTLQRQTDWRHVKNSRVGARSAYQYIGPGDDRITLSGWVAPELTGSAASIDMLRRMAGTGKPYLMLSGSGQVLGAYVVMNLVEDQTLFYVDGTPRRVEFTVTLECVDDGRAGSLFGAGLQVPVDILDGSPADWGIFQ